MFSELFTIVVDMLAILVHGTLAGELSDKGDENKKVHQSLIRKLKVCDTTCYCIIQCVDKKTHPLCFAIYVLSKTPKAFQMKLTTIVALKL